MAETVTLPGVGTVKTQYLWGGAALTAGIVGYAWWRARGDAGAEVEGVGVPGDDFGDDYASEAPGGGGGPTTGYGGGSTTVTPDTPMPPRSNDEWSQRVIERMGDYGYESAMVSSAVGKYLSRQPLSAAEADLINQARAIMGPPPVGEYPVTLVSTPTPTTPAPPTTTAPRPTTRPTRPTYARVSATTTSTMTLVWRSVSGHNITHYEVHMDGRPGGLVTKTPSAVIRALRPRSKYTFRIRAINAAGPGPLATVTGKTK